MLKMARSDRMRIIWIAQKTKVFVRTLCKRVDRRVPHRRKKIRWMDDIRIVARNNWISAWKSGERNNEFTKCN